MEEIIVYNPDTELVENYCVIVKQAKYTLDSIIQVWKDPKKREQEQEFFSSEKLAFYFF